MRVNTRPMRDRIISLVRRDPTLADDDRRLIANVWYEEGWHDPDLYKHLQLVSTSETIRRTRQKLREEGIIKTSKTTDAARFDEMGNVREDLGY